MIRRVQLQACDEKDFVVPMQTVILPATIDVLDKINAILESLLTGSLEPSLLKTQLVVEELLANICSYAYDGAGEARFACGIVNFDGKKAIMIELTDNGRAYDPFANAKEPNLEASIEEREIGGLGLHLVKEIATHYIYMRIDNCNQTQIIIDVKD